ncbi:MAG: RNA polymerase sigma factor [Deltaproteobacteria bacterium]
MVALRQSHLRLLAPTAMPSAPAIAPDDHALLAGLERREPTASAAFYDRARPIVDRTLSRLLGSRDPDYEDVAQAALYELIQTLKKFRQECPLDAWLSIVTARVAYRQIRRRRLERHLFSQTPADALAADPSALPVPFAARQAVERICSHLASINKKHAWTFLLHDAYGYSLAQVAQIMDTSVSAAQSRLVRGRREVHKRIGADAGLVRFFDDLSEEVP